MKLLITRPEPQATQWVEQLQGAGLDAAALPLIAIEGPRVPEAVQRCWQTLASVRLVMFVSPAAAQWFFDLRPAEIKWPNHTLAAAPGPGTARSVIQAGAAAGLPPSAVMSPREDAPQFDSETLWPLLASMDWQGQSVVIVSGGDAQQTRGRAWLSEQWRACGATVNAVLTYQRMPASWSAKQQQLAQAALLHPDQYAWLFSSSEAVDNLVSRSPTDTSWHQVRAMVTHPRIAEQAARAGIGQVELTRPTIDAVVQTLRSLS